MIRKTTNEFKEEVFNLVGDEYIVLGEYKNALTKIKMKHITCSYEYEVKPNSFLSSGSRCPKCYGTPKKTHEQFVNEINKIVGKEYSVIGHYVNSKTKIKLVHNLCGYEYDIEPASFLCGNRCPKCHGTPKKTHNDFINEVYVLVGNEYSVLSKYTDSNTKITLRHNSCGYIYDVLPNSFIGNKQKKRKGRRCPKCAGNIKKTTDDFKKEVYNLVGDDYTVLGEYINGKTKITMRHNICNYEYEVTPPEFTSSGTRCPKCAGNSKKTTEQFKKEVYDLVGDEFSVLGEYINAHKKIKIKHNYCGNIIYMPPHSFLKGYRCSKCSSYQSAGEKAIEKWLVKHKVKYKTEKTFEDLKDKSYLRFDFYVPYKENFGLLIEYHGKQHYEYLPNIQKNIKNFHLAQTRDNIKKEYCLKNNYTLLIIPYWEFENITTILNNKIDINQIITLEKNLKLYKSITGKFKDRVVRLVGNDYEVLGNYINANTKIKMKHIECNQTFEMRPSAFLNLGQRCPHCYGSHKKSHEEYVKEVFDLVGDEYSVLSQYINANSKIKFRHNICGYEYKKIAVYFLSGYRCPKCSGRIKKTTKQFKEELFECVGNEYEVMSEYINSKTKIKIKHQLCGNLIEDLPYKFLKKDNPIRCKKCY